VVDHEALGDDRGTVEEVAQRGDVDGGPDLDERGVGHLGRDQLGLADRGDRVEDAGQDQGGHVRIREVGIDDGPVPGDDRPFDAVLVRRGGTGGPLLDGERGECVGGFGRVVLDGLRELLVALGGR
jgi:hypothetical protein